MTTDAMVSTAGQMLIAWADKRRRARASVEKISLGFLSRVVKLLLHLAGFGAFIWSMFQVHSVAGGLAIMVSCFVFSTLIGGSSQPDNASTNNVR